ncbi:hypothetical protein Fmac_020472 [Flemingia macrophylla]|uniref:Uncharacterized protein n=1 Tax=Flemingia macrophylla TaxID=520843 RepID=A0ABD1LU31_9FABA
MTHYSLVSMMLQKVILAAMIVVLFSFSVRSQTFCKGTCREFPDCDAHCKFIGYETGKCIISKCCCSVVSL